MNESLSRHKTQTEPQLRFLLVFFTLLLLFQTRKDLSLLIIQARYCGRILAVQTHGNFLSTVGISKGIDGIRKF